MDAVWLRVAAPEEATLSGSKRHISFPSHISITGMSAPKAMAHYTTDPNSLLPWNNQFSYSYGFDEFGPQQMPIFGINYIERKRVEVLRLDKDGKKWLALCTLLDWDPLDAARSLQPETGGAINSA